MFPALEKTDRIYAQPGAVGQVLLRKAGRVPVSPQEIAEGWMLAGVHCSFSLACVLRDSRKCEILPVRGHDSTLPTLWRSSIVLFT